MFGNLKIATRMGVAFGVMLVLMLLMAAIATLNQIQGEKDGQTVLAMEREAYQADEWVSQTQLNVTRVLALAQSQAHPAVDAYFSPQIAQTTQRINELQKQLEAVITTPEGKALFSAVGKLRAEYIDARKSFFDTLKAGDHPKADELLKSFVLPKAEAYVAKMREMAKSQHDAVVAEANSRHAAQQVRVYWLNGLGALALVLGVWIAWAITRSVTLPIRQAVGFAGGIAAGRLDQSIVAGGQDEVGQLLRSLADMQAALVKMVTAVHQSAANIEIASAEVAAGNQDLSVRTESAASSLETTASSMEQINATVRQSADAARQANQLANSAASVATRGGQVVGDVVGTMQDISHSSQKIADIIGVIDGIAFQTNILALNAAVEAARAGEQGRGFAVVAGEVRNLAQRSSQAAKEIKDLIGASVDRVRTGSDQVQQAGSTMTEIVASVQRVNDIIGEITAAAGEQSNGIAQVNVAVTQLDQMTQQNAALVEQSAAAAQSLRAQARQLVEAVSAFNLGSQDVLSRLTPAPANPSAAVLAPPRVEQGRAVVPVLKKSATKTIAKKPFNKSDEAQKISKLQLQKTAAPVAPTPPVSASVAVAKPAAGDGDWETF